MNLVLTLCPVQVPCPPGCVSQQLSSAGNHGHDQAEKRILFPVGQQQSVILLLLKEESPVVYVRTFDTGGPLYPAPA